MGTDIIYDKQYKDFVVHWSSAHRLNNFGPKAIYYSRTKDFKHFSKPKILYKKEDSGVIDSAMYEEDEFYYLFVKSERNPETIILLHSEYTTGPFKRVEAFYDCMKLIERGMYEAPTAVKTADGH